jgi:hypothetical protein
LICSQKQSKTYKIRKNYMAITNSQQARQMYNQGGYADMGLMAPRQNYGLGSFVKKAVRGVKKIAKSPIGKAALLYAGGAYLGGSTALGGAGGSFMSRMANPSGLMNLANIPGYLGGKFNPMQGPNLPGKGGSFFSKLNPFGENFSGKTALLTGGALATALPFMMGGDDKEEEVSESFTGMPSSIQNIMGQAKDYYKGGAQASNLNFMPQKKFVQENWYGEDGGRAGYAGGGEIIDEEEELVRSGAGLPFRQAQTFLNMGGGAGDQQAQQMLMMAYAKYKKQGGDMPFEQFVQAVMQQQQQEGSGMEQPTMAANGGRMGYAEGGGIMDTEQAEMIDMGGQEKDFRETGGFVEMGGKERADDVPARLSKNEFVFTADAVRQAGGGDIDQGSAVMQNLMDNLESGGQISRASQGLGGEEEIVEEPNGAQAMYEQQQALQSRMA